MAPEMYEEWDWNGPEEGDEVDLSIIVMFDGEEVLQLDGNENDVEGRKSAARRLCALLNLERWRTVA